MSAISVFYTWAKVSIKSWLWFHVAQQWLAETSKEWKQTSPEKRKCRAAIFQMICENSMNGTFFIFYFFEIQLWKADNCEAVKHLHREGPKPKASTQQCVAKLVSQDFSHILYMFFCFFTAKPDASRAKASRRGRSSYTASILFASESVWWCQKLRDLMSAVSSPRTQTAGVCVCVSCVSKTA